jgi:hypothetical protein
VRTMARPLNLQVTEPVANGFSDIDSELPVSSAELILVSMFTASTPSQSLSKTEKPLPRGPLADVRGNSVQNYESRIGVLDAKKMQDSGPGTRFYGA